MEGTVEDPARGGGPGNRRRRILSRREVDPHPVTERFFDVETLNIRPRFEGREGEEELRQLQSDLETLERLFQTVLGQSFTAQLARNIDVANGNNIGIDECPPASSKVLEELIEITISEDDLVDDCNKECCICFFQNDLGDKVVRLPCGHLFHKECICEWLAKKCTCPICRYEMPTDNAAYEVERIERMKTRQIRLKPYELNRMSIVELQELADTEESDHDKLIDILQSSDNVDIIAPDPQEAAQHPQAGNEETNHRKKESNGEEQKEEVQSSINETEPFTNSMVASN